jgi:hypothetical protein
VKAILRQKLSNVLKGDRIQRRKWDTGKFNDPEVCKEYEGAIIKGLEEVQETDDVEEEWKRIKKLLTDTAEQVIGEKKSGQNEEWFDNECWAAIEEKNRNRQKALQRETGGKQEKYGESRKKANKICHRKKREGMKRQTEEMEDLWE